MKPARAAVTLLPGVEGAGVGADIGHKKEGAMTTTENRTDLPEGRADKTKPGSGRDQGRKLPKSKEKPAE